MSQTQYFVFLYQGIQMIVQNKFKIKKQELWILMNYISLLLTENVTRYHFYVALVMSEKKQMVWYYIKSSKQFKWIEIGNNINHMLFLSSRKMYLSRLPFQKSWIWVWRLCRFLYNTIRRIKKHILLFKSNLNRLNNHFLLILWKSLIKDYWTTWRTNIWFDWWRYVCSTLWKNLVSELPHQKQK